MTPPEKRGLQYYLHFFFFNYDHYIIFQKRSGVLQPNLCYFTLPSEQATPESAPEPQSSFCLEQLLMVQKKPFGKLSQRKIQYCRLLVPRPHG